ncbi:UNVERIFIED_CONTAM: hypothetical protein FKN15_013705 [Acipenser sinensis]
MVSESVGAPTTLEMESIEELIKRINRNTAAQIEQTARFERWAIDMGLAPPKIQEREPTELERLIQAWELPLPEPREVELPLPEPREGELPLPEPREVELPLPEPREVELPLPEPREVELPLPEPREVELPLPEPREVELPLPEKEGALFPSSQSVRKGNDFGHCDSAPFLDGWLPTDPGMNCQTIQYEAHSSCSTAPSQIGREIVD